MIYFCLLLFSVITLRRFSFLSHESNDGKITRSEGDEGQIGDLNSDGRTTRSEARAAKKAKIEIEFFSLP